MTVLRQQTSDRRGDSDLMSCYRSQDPGKSTQRLSPSRLGAFGMVRWSSALIKFDLGTVAS